MLKTGQIRRIQGLKNLGRHVAAMRNFPYFAITAIKKKDSFVSERYLAMSTKHQRFDTVCATIHWVKQAWQAKLILLTSILLMEGPSGDASRDG